MEQLPGTEIQITEITHGNAELARFLLSEMKFCVANMQKSFVDLSSRPQDLVNISAKRELAMETSENAKSVLI
jgi:hypothetical protein